jgi:CRISPR-associated exonuclease Cas4
MRHAGPRDRDVAQLMTYYLLAEDVWGAHVTHGVIEYRDSQRFPILYDPAERAQVLALAEELRRSRQAPDVPRDHQEAWKCRRCGFTAACGQALG